MLYILGISRFFIILSSLDTGSAFEGMGASREALYSAMVEPVVFVSLLTLLRISQTMNLPEALMYMSPTKSIILIFIAVPMFIVILVENARIPFDDPTTHLELTMIHEVMILDNSGPSLGLMEYASFIKLWFFSLIFTKLIVPDFHISLGYKFLLEMGVMSFIAVVIGIIESTFARVTLLRIPRVIFTAGIISFLGFFITVTNFLEW